MPPLVLEAGLALTLLGTAVKLTTAVNRIEQNQKIGHTELIGKIEVVKTQVGTLEREIFDVKREVKESRKSRFTDKD